MGEKTIDLGDSKSPELQCHLMPCLIDYNESTVKAKEYFWPTIKSLESNCEDEPSRVRDKHILTASFRGKPLQGRKIQLPENYKGLVLNKDSKLEGKFQEFTYWNWDELPSDEDSVVKALQWINVSKAIHGEITD